MAPSPPSPRVSANSSLLTPSPSTPRAILGPSPPIRFSSGHQCPQGSPRPTSGAGYPNVQPCSLFPPPPGPLPLPKECTSPSLPRFPPNLAFSRQPGYEGRHSVQRERSQSWGSPWSEGLLGAGAEWRAEAGGPCALCRGWPRILGEAGPGSLPFALNVTYLPGATCCCHASSRAGRGLPTPGHASLLVLSPWPSSVVLGRPLSTLAGPSPRGHTGMLEASLRHESERFRRSPQFGSLVRQQYVGSSKAGQRNWEELEMKTQLLMQAGTVCRVTTSGGKQ